MKKKSAWTLEQERELADLERRAAMLSTGISTLTESQVLQWRIADRTRFVARMEREKQVQGQIHDIEAELARRKALKARKAQ